MALSAQKAKEASMANALKKEIEDRQSLRERCASAVTDMIKEGGTAVEVPLESQDFKVLETVTEEMRNLDYKFCLVEERDSETREIMEQYLRISVAHISV